MSTRSKTLLVLFAVLCLAQVAVPARMLWLREQVLRSGEPFRFRCAPVDPADPLRGRYVALRFEADQVPAPTFEVRRGDRLVVPVARDGDGWATLGAPRPTPPEDGAWLTVEATGDFDPDRADGDDRLRVRLPFERFYLQETRAPEAERAIAELGADAVPVWLEVRVLDGRAVADDLILGGGSVREALDDGKRPVPGN